MAPGGFEHLAAVRSGGIAGLRACVDVDADLHARVVAFDQAVELELSDAEGAELVAAAGRFVESGGGVSSARVFDAFTYDVTITWGGTEHHVRSIDVGAGAALQPVLAVVSHLLARAPGPAGR